MKASVNTKYGPPEVLQVQEVAKPKPKANEVLIKIHATTINRTDCGFRKPDYIIVRFFNGFFKPQRSILGNEFAGEVEEVGPSVRTFKPGDQVFGLSAYKFGAHAEYICIAEDSTIANKPFNMSYYEAAAVCDGLMLGMSLIRKIDFTHSPKILINGSAGSIGSACLQLAKHFGAHVTAVCRAQHATLVKSLGADEVIDFKIKDFTKSSQCYDVILDTVGKSSFFKCKRLLTAQGVYYSTELGFLSQNIFLALITPLLGGKKVNFPIATASQKDIVRFKELIEAGHYQAVVDRIYPLEKIVEATQYVETGEKMGNVIITI
jgi:NADPH:quinone reductase-like Zn-dependent oxidoreductase